MKGMTIIVKTISSWVKMLIFLYGIYVVLFGHLTPGGGFAGGVILASCYVLLMLAFGREFIEKNLPLPLASKLDCLGAFLFADPGIQRGPVELACIRGGQAMFVEATSGLKLAPGEIWGRRSLFRVGGKPLLVTEVFLPAIETAS